VPLLNLTEIATAVGTEARFAEFRKALLAFYGEQNERLEKASEAEGWSFIPDLLGVALEKEHLLVD
jgi:hypothetical protein